MIGTGLFLLLFGAPTAVAGLAVQATGAMTGDRAFAYWLGKTGRAVTATGVFMCVAAIFCKTAAILWGGANP